MWGREVGDGTANGIPGWGNSELEYYTDGTDNAATDGQGNLVITVKEADGSLMCYYGPCEYTSARLLTKNRFEVAYGRVEARIKVPDGAGLWPAFWMLGTDIDQVNWPQTGEIDIMEYVGRLPNEVFGTLHGPGYSGGQSYGDTYDLGEPVARSTSTSSRSSGSQTGSSGTSTAFSSSPPRRTIAFLQGKQWVFNHPFFILLNVAVGGNFGGAVGADTVFPQTHAVDYVRLYQTQPSTDYPLQPRSAMTSPAGGRSAFRSPPSRARMAPSLDLTNVQALRFNIPDGSRKPVLLDQIRLSCPERRDRDQHGRSGAGSLRKALDSVCAGGTVTFSAALAGQTITLLSGPLTLGKNVTIDGSAAPGLTISGNDADRVFIVNAGTTATVKSPDGHRWLWLAAGRRHAQQRHADPGPRHRHREHHGTTNAGDFWQGGGGDLQRRWRDAQPDRQHRVGQPGALVRRRRLLLLQHHHHDHPQHDQRQRVQRCRRRYPLAWQYDDHQQHHQRQHGRPAGMAARSSTPMAICTIPNSTIANNIGPDWAPSSIFIGQLRRQAVPTLTLTNTIVTGNHWYACEQFASGTVGNV